jgi:hypothetical protein
MRCAFPSSTKTCCAPQIFPDADEKFWPSGRSYHACALLADGSLCTVGGYRGGYDTPNDVSEGLCISILRGSAAQDISALRTQGRQSRRRLGAQVFFCGPKKNRCHRIFCLVALSLLVLCSLQACT